MEPVFCCFQLQQRVFPSGIQIKKTLALGQLACLGREAEKFQLYSAFLLYQTLKQLTQNIAANVLHTNFFFSKSRVQFPAREGQNVFKNAKNDLEAIVEKVSKLLVIKRYPFTSIIPVLMSIFLIC